MTFESPFLVHAETFDDHGLAGRKGVELCVGKGLMAYHSRVHRLFPALQDQLARHAPCTVLT